MFEFGSTFYERIENILEMQKISKTQFYTDLKISKTTVLNWKKRNLPSLEVMLDLSNYLDVSIYWLLTGQNIQKSHEPDSAAQIVNRIKGKLTELAKGAEYEVDTDTFYMPLHECIKPYELTKWFYGIQFPTIKKLEDIAKNLHLSLDYLITGSKFISNDNEKYYNTVESELDVFLKYYNCLTDNNRAILFEVCKGLFMNQDYAIKLQTLNDSKQLWERMNDPYKDITDDNK